jgi:sec-independent protein translocase protein TatB
MFGFGLLEILFIMALALILIGPKQLPEVARAVAKFLNELKRLSNDITHSLTEIKSAPQDYMKKVVTDTPADNKPEPSEPAKPT